MPSAKMAIGKPIAIVPLGGRWNVLKAPNDGPGMSVMDLFDMKAEEERAGLHPLAMRMSPRTFDEFVGQEEIVGPGRILRRAIERDVLPSMIFWGPAGCGKTALAKIIARMTKAKFMQLNAVTAGVSDIRKAVDAAREELKLYGRRTIVFIDEIHRFNKAQQDALLPFVEDGTLVMIGATTENPFFEVISPLVSRSKVFRLRPLTPAEIELILQRAISDPERGFGRLDISVEPGALEWLSRISDGDARAALNALDLVVRVSSAGPDGPIRLTRDSIDEVTQRTPIHYDQSGDYHYDTISAFIKSMRGSDPDAALYWLARMIHAGEDPIFIARRIVIAAAEDVGLADPQALVVAVAAAQAAHMVGLPEAAIPLAEATVYVACAPKSNSAYKALLAAKEAVRSVTVQGVPPHLRSGGYGQAAKFGDGVGYTYPHDFPGHFVRQEYLPPELKGEKFYIPTTQGCEERIAEWLSRLHSTGLNAGGGDSSDAGGDSPSEGDRDEHPPSE